MRSLKTGHYVQRLPDGFGVRRELMVNDYDRAAEILRAVRVVVASKDHEECYGLRESVSAGHYLYMVNFKGGNVSGLEWFHMTFPLFSALRNKILRKGEYVFALDYQSDQSNGMLLEKLSYVRWAITSGHIYRHRGWSHAMAADYSQEVMNHPIDQEQSLPVTLVSEEELRQMILGPGWKRLWLFLKRLWRRL